MKIYAVIITLLISTVSFGQTEKTEPDSASCARYKSLYFMYLQQGAIFDARTFYLQAFHYCGGTTNLHAGFFTNGKVLYKKIIDSTRAMLEESTLIQLQDSLKWIYDQKRKLEYDPEWDLEFAGYMMGTNDQRFDKLDTLFRSVDTLKENTSSSIINMYFRHLILNRYNKAKEVEKPKLRERITDEFFKLVGYCQTAIENADKAGDTKKVKSYRDVIDFMDKYFIMIYPGPDEFAKMMELELIDLSPAPDQRKWQIQRAVKLLEDKKAERTETYRKYVKEMVLLEPTPEGYFGLGKIEAEKKNYKGAIDFFEKAITLDTAKEHTNEYLYEIAETYQKTHQYDRAFEAAKKVGGKYAGAALQMCAEIIAAKANDCGDSTFERKANYWLANDYIRRAAAAGAKVDLDKYMNNAPKLPEIFDAGEKEGSKIELKCWNETTVIRVSN